MAPPDIKGVVDTIATHWPTISFVGLRVLARLGVRTEPIIRFGQPAPGTLGPTDRRVTHHRWAHVGVMAETRPRSRVTRWLPTIDATRCTGTIQVISVIDRNVVLEDDVVFAGRIGPVQEWTLGVDDDRAYIPLWIDSRDYVPHPNSDALNLAPGVYLTGARFVMRGQTETEALPIGSYVVRLTIRSRALTEPQSREWPLRVDVFPGPEPDLSLEIVRSAQDASLRLVHVRPVLTRRRRQPIEVGITVTIANVTYRLRFDDETWEGTGLAAISHFHAPQILIAAWTPDATRDLLGVPLPQRTCVLADEQFRVHHRVHVCIPGPCDCPLTLTLVDASGQSRGQASFTLAVSESGIELRP